MTRIWLAIALLYSVSAVAECRPEGRKVFAEGLDALARADLSTAAAHFTALVRSQPTCAEARNNLAVVEVEQGRLSEAAEELRQALRFRPDYERARRNLERVTALLAPQPERAPHPSVTPEAPAGQTLGAAATTPAPSPPVAGVSQPEPTPTAATLPAPAGIVALEPPGARAAIIDPQERRMCLYTRTAEAIIPEVCYPLPKLRVESWPQWLVASETGNQRIRLSDGTGRRDLQIVPEGAGLSGNLIWLGKDDFSSLAAKVVPWRTVWIVAEKSAPAADATVEATIRQAIGHWRVAWEQKRFDPYVAAYSPSFVPQSEPSFARWRARKERLFEQSGTISVAISSPCIFLIGGGASALTVFDQHYRSQTTADHELKALVWLRDGADWKITAERVLASLPNTAPSGK